MSIPTAVEPARYAEYAAATAVVRREIGACIMLVLPFVVARVGAYGMRDCHEAAEADAVAVAKAAYVSRWWSWDELTSK